MSFVLSVVCLQPVAGSTPDAGPLIVEEALQDERARDRAGYVAGLSKYFDSPVHGRSYHVFVDIGDQFPSSAPFFQWPEDDPDDTKPILLQIEGVNRPAFDTLLRSLLNASSLGEVLVVCEWNGDVTRADVSREEALEDLAAGDVYLYGPWMIREFWHQQDNGLVNYPSVTIVREA